MAAPKIVLCVVLAAAPALWLPAAAQAQGSVGSPATGQWFASGRGALGLSLGSSRYGAACGGTAFVCDNTDQAFRVSAGTMVGNYWGVELGYVDLGRIARAGGTTRAHGLNLSLVGKAPLFQSLGVFGRVGTTYGRTETSSLVPGAAGVGTGRGLGLSYGAGLSFDFTPRLSATLEWESTDFRFAGGGRDPVRSTNLGLKYRY